jgi:uncharacterized protein YbjT (DUF2867 family)
MPPPDRLILLTGATGYIGGRLLRLLEERGERVRCLARRPEALEGRVAPATEVVRGDLQDPDSLSGALAGVTTAYYLVHMLGAQGDFEALERETAQHFAEAARKTGVQRVIYLGGLSQAPETSSHMRSRHAVGDILRDAGLQVIEFQASVIIGSGSLSFELVRALVQRLPIMITPRWVSVKAQPLAIADVLAYLLAALDLDVGENRTYEIGGPDQMSYLDLMRAYGRIRGLRRHVLRVPVLTPWLSSLWLDLVTPLYARVGRRLIDSITAPSVVKDPRALQDFDIRPMGVDAAIRQALANEDREMAETHWADALSTVGTRRYGGVRYGNRLVDSRSVTSTASPKQAFAAVRRIGGGTGWYYGRWLWELRGLLDRAVGGVGMRRGRRDPEHLRAGDVVDFWRVEAFEEGCRLRLAAEMRLPGRAWLEFEVKPDAKGSRVYQTAIFDPLGWLGLAYWYALYPAHVFVFRGMLRNLVRQAEKEMGPTGSN